MLLPLLLLPLVAALPPLPPHSAQELAPADDQAAPSCEQLRAMWLFSKRQSRASQISNEIPTYRDPFAYAFGTLRTRQNTGARPGTPMYPRYRSGAVMKPRYTDYGRLVPSPAWQAGRMLQRPRPRMPVSSFQDLRNMYLEQRKFDEKQRLVEEAAAARRKDTSHPATYGRLVETAPTSLDLVRAEARGAYKRDQQQANPTDLSERLVEASPEQVDDNPW